MKIVALCCTYNRHTCLERSVKMFMDQDYKDEHVMVIFNTGKPITPAFQLKEGSKKIIIVNVDKTFNSVGEKYNAAIEHWSHIGADAVVSWDDDDIFLPNHLSEGVRGLKKALAQDKYAYKPQKSYYRDKNGVALVENTLEPSIFVDADWLSAMGYAPVNVRYHQQWLDPLTGRGKILVDPDGIPTLVYNWGEEIPVYKMSGTGDDGGMNFVNHMMRSVDTGKGQLNPWEDKQIAPYYEQIENFKKSL